jgi:hypothetical protein
MATNSRVMSGLDPADVFAAFRDGYTYGNWVVGTRKIRRVETGWPDVGTAIHFTVGYKPFRKDDETRVVRYEPDRELELEAHAWPAGAAAIILTVEQTAPGDTTITIQEHPSKGLAEKFHNPLLDLLIKVRNVESLRRLEKEARQKAAAKSN